MEIINSFERQATGVISDGEITKRDGNIVPIYLIDSFHVLTQFVGYAKFKNRFYGNVYFRGQTSLHSGKLIPSLFRPSLNSTTVNYSERFNTYNTKREKALSSNKAFNNIEPYAIEPLLQHYGIKTTWLDIVDNLWVALWFGLHKFSSITIEDHEHVHITEDSSEQYAYLFLLAVDAQQERQKYKPDGYCQIPGVYSGKETNLVDLRKAVQSYYLRPHAQHALMILKKQILTKTPLSESDVDYSDFIVGIAKIRRERGLAWIGNSGLLSIQSLFPPAYFDNGYRSLLEHYKVASDAIPTYGSIQFISY